MQSRAKRRILWRNAFRTCSRHGVYGRAGDCRTSNVRQRVRVFRKQNTVPGRGEVVTVYERKHLPDGEKTIGFFFIRARDSQIGTYIVGKNTAADNSPNGRNRSYRVFVCTFFIIRAYLFTVTTPPRTSFDSNLTRRPAPITYTVRTIKRAINRRGVGSGEREFFNRRRFTFFPRRAFGGGGGGGACARA